MWTPKGSSKLSETREIRCAWPSCSFSTTDEKIHGASTDENRLLNWWYYHTVVSLYGRCRTEILAIPASEVAVERLFSGG